MNNTDRLILGVLALGAIIALTYLVAPLLQTPEPKTVIELVIAALSTFGTLAAVVVALWLGRDGQRRLDRVDGYRATLAAARIRHQISALSRCVSSGFAGVAFSEAHADKDAQIRAFIANVGPILQSFTDEDFLSLMPLPNHVGGRLASTVARLRMLMSTYRTMTSLDLLQVANIQQTYVVLSEANQALQILAEAIDELALGAAPAFTFEEKYGAGDED